MDVVRFVDRVGHDGLVTNALFEDLVILGPAVVTFLDHVALNECRFEALQTFFSST
jgi:hypothetical protein